MNDDIFNELLESVQQADEMIQSGSTQIQNKAARVTEFAELEVRAIRAKTGLSQNHFANVLGVSKRTLENWEQGRRQPTHATLTSQWNENKVTSGWFNPR